MDGLVNALRFAVNTSKRTRVALILYILSAEAAPFSFHDFHRVGNALPHVSRNILGDRSIYCHALKGNDALEV